jgi:hypothetical protein
MELLGHDIRTEADLSKLSSSELVELHNQKAEKPTRRFSDRAAAIRRVWAVISEEVLLQEEKVAALLCEAKFDQVRTVGELIGVLSSAFEADGGKAEEQANESQLEMEQIDALELSEPSTCNLTEHVKTVEGIVASALGIAAAELNVSAAETVTKVEALLEKPARARRGNGMSFRMRPRAEKSEPRVGSKRAAALELLSRRGGAAFSEVMERCEWSRKDAYEGIRLVNVVCGRGLWNEELKEGQSELEMQVRVVTEAEFDHLVGVASGRIRA